MPEVCYQWKIELIHRYGKQYVEVKAIGESIIDTSRAAEKCCQETGKTFIHPSNSQPALIGNGTIVFPIRSFRVSK